MLNRAQIIRLRRSRPIEPNKIKVAMKLAGLTQMQVSKAIGIAQSQISEDATGRYTEMTLEKARAYARLFGCSVDDLFPEMEEAVA